MGLFSASTMVTEGLSCLIGSCGFRGVSSKGTSAPRLSIEAEKRAIAGRHSNQALTFNAKGERESHTMKTRSRFAVFAAVCLGLFSVLAGAAYASPVVTNVTAAQRADGSGLVDIAYDVAGGVEPMTVSVTVSNDNGETWAVTPDAQYLSGDVGTGVVNGTAKAIVWDIGTDRPGICWPQSMLRISVLVSPEPGGLVEMLPVEEGWFEMGYPWDEGDEDEYPVHDVYLDAYQIGKYEVTNAQAAAIFQWAYDNNKIDTVTELTVTHNGQELLDLDDSGCKIAFSDEGFFDQNA